LSSILVNLNTSTVMLDRCLLIAKNLLLTFPMG
jgi:hypothetical protein